MSGELKLFVIYVGGAHELSFVELHDMRFVVGRTIEDTYPALRKTWWGTPQRLHLDAWGSLRYADGYQISVSEKMSSAASDVTSPKLYFVNLGGYDSKQFTELHKNVFVVAESPAAAKTRAVQQIADWESPHRDYQFEVEHIVSISDVIASTNTSSNCQIILTPSAEEIPFEFTCRYVPIASGS